MKTKIISLEGNTKKFNTQIADLQLLLTLERKVSEKQSEVALAINAEQNKRVFKSLQSIKADVMPLQEQIDEIKIATQQLSEASNLLSVSAEKIDRATRSLSKTSQEEHRRSIDNLKSLQTLEGFISDLKNSARKLTSMVSDVIETSAVLRTLGFNAKLIGSRGQADGADKFLVVAGNIRKLSDEVTGFANTQSADIDRSVELITQSFSELQNVKANLERSTTSSEETAEEIKRLEEEMMVLASSATELSATIDQFNSSTLHFAKTFKLIIQQIDLIIEETKHHTHLSSIAMSFPVRFTKLAGSTRSLETATQRMMTWLQKEAMTELVMARTFITFRYHELSSETQKWITAKHGKIDRGTMFLCLVGSSGAEKPWNSRHDSKDRQAIPLLDTPEGMETMPIMFRDMFQKMNIAYETTIHPERLSKNTIIDGYSLVTPALGSELIPIQEPFVVKYNIQSLLGIGGRFASGRVFASVLFSKEAISEPDAEKLKTLPLSLLSSLTPLETQGAFWN